MAKKSIYLLHTAQVHLQRFEKLIAPFDDIANFNQVVCQSLLDKAEKINGVSDEIIEETNRTLTDLVQQGADTILITCSTLGGIASQSPKIENCAILRIDDILAEEALKLGQHLAIICAVKSTIDPTRQLFKQKAKELGKTDTQLDIHLVPEAWEKFKAGDYVAYSKSIATYIQNHAKTVDVVVLAQASMDEVVHHLDGFDPIVVCSPELALQSLMQK